MMGAFCQNCKKPIEMEDLNKLRIEKDHKSVELLVCDTCYMLIKTTRKA